MVLGILIFNPLYNMSKSYTLAEIAEKLGLEYQGENIKITRVNTIEAAGETELTFLANPKYIPKLNETKAGAIIIRKDMAEKVKNAIICDEPYYAFARCIALFAEIEGTFDGISPFASIAHSAQIGENCIIYPYVYIGENVKIGDNCKIFSGTYIGENSILGDNCTLFPNCVLMSKTILGDDCVLQPGAVLGGEGYGFVRTDFGIHKIPQIGQVVIGDNVEIGANTTIDRASLNVTSVADGTCIDNLVMVAHNVNIGKECFIISQVGIAGSTSIGDKCTLAGQAGLAGHLAIGNNVTIGPQAGIAKNLENNDVVMGSPSMDYGKFMRVSTLMPKLPELFKRMSKLEKIIENLEKEEK